MLEPTSATISLLLANELRLRHSSGRRIKQRDLMDVEKTIAEIEWLEHIYSLADKRPQTLADRHAANQRHDESNVNNPWFRLWQRYGIPR